MCVIVNQPAGTRVTKARAKRLWQVNPDGGGFAYIKDGSIQVFKTMSFRQWWMHYRDAVNENPESDFVLHMRIATHGTIDITNVHPFQVDEHTVMAHNGIIKDVPDYKDGRSDTQVFVDEVLPELPEDWLDKPYLVNMVEEWIGWSKLTFLTTNPKLKHTMYTINRASGTEADGMWFSNSKGVEAPPKKKTCPHCKDKQFPSAITGSIQNHMDYCQANPDRLRFCQECRKSHALTAECAPKLEVVKNELATAEGSFSDVWKKAGPRSGEKWDKEEAEATLAVWRHERAHLKKVRLDMQIPHPVTWTSAQGWLCIGCAANVDEETGECECYNTCCMDCWMPVAGCTCEPKDHERRLMDIYNLDTQTWEKVQANWIES